MPKHAVADATGSTASTSASSSYGVSRHSALAVRRNSSTEEDSETGNDIQTGTTAMRYVFLARFQDANQLLTSTRHNSTSPALSATHSFVAFTQALVSYESDMILEAVALWKETEKLCSASKHDTIGDKLEQKVLLADAKICSTFLHLLQSADFGGLFKGGWTLRQAWKLYQGTYDDLLKQIDTDFRKGDLTKSEMAILRQDLPHPVQGDGATASSTIDRALTDSQPSPHFLRTRQILGSVCYGYGCFHLLLSLLPGHLLKWLKFLGFDGDLHVGIRALTYSMNSPDAKSLLARMTLIWFHTVIQTYYAIDEDQMQEGIKSAAVLLESLDDQLRASPLVQFFDCRLKRFRGEVSSAIQSYTSALESSTYVKEINVLLHHESGILHFQLQEWAQSVEHLLKCFNQGRWGKILYAYLIGLCYAMLKSPAKALEFMTQVPGLHVMKGAPLELFLTDRAKLLTKEHLSIPAIPSLLAMEVIYFLNCPRLRLEPLCRSMISALDSVTNPTFVPLRYFMQGALHEDVREVKQSMQCYREAIRMGDQLCSNSAAKNAIPSCGEHVPAFASYELAVLLCKADSTFEEGKTFFAKSGDTYSHCHFRNRLHVKIHLAKKALGES